MKTAVDLSAYIKRLVDDAPPLTPEQRARLAILLRTDSKEKP